MFHDSYENPFDSTSNKRIIKFRVSLTFSSLRSLSENPCRNSLGQSTPRLED